MSAVCIIKMTQICHILLWMQIASNKIWYVNMKLQLETNEPHKQDLKHLLKLKTTFFRLKHHNMTPKLCVRS